MCERLVQGRYLTAARSGVELATSRVASQRLNHYTTRPGGPRLKISKYTTDKIVTLFVLYACLETLCDHQPGLELGLGLGLRLESLVTILVQ